MKLLHSSDWHLGISLMGRKRYEEHQAFLSWLLDTITQEGIDVLLLSGDVFDSSLPSNYAQELYYNFLHKLTRTPCRHIVIIAGNHDSPTLLNAPSQLLKQLGIHVLGSMCENASEEVITLCKPDGAPELIVCAVPYLRERDLRTVESYESPEQKEQKLLAGISRHYQDVFAHAFALQASLDPPPPVIAMGHLFAAGAKLNQGEAVRELYIGNLLFVPDAIFPAELAYVALGHLHAQQRIASRDALRYSGSPIPLNFAEARIPRQVLCVEINETVHVQALNIPQIRDLHSISGDWEAIQQALQELLLSQKPAWLEVIYQGKAVMPNLREEIGQSIMGSPLELLCLKNERQVQQALATGNLHESLDDLSLGEVFQSCLQKHGIEETEDLLSCYNSIIQGILEQDSNAE